MGWSLKASEKKGVGDLTWLEWVRQLEEDGNDVTGMLDEEPEMFSDLAIYWNAFHILSPSRSSGMSVGSIALPAYESYFRIFGVDSLEEQLNYLKFVGVLDSEYLKWQGEKSEENRKKNERKSKGQRPPKK